MGKDVTARWEVPMSDGVHVVELEHGTISGRRVIWVNNKEVHREDWLFKLVGKEHFKVGKTKCCITIETEEDGLGYEYTLEVNGKSLEKFKENQNKVMQCWHTFVAGEPYRIVLENHTLDVYVNGRIAETAREFTDEGTETHFAVGDRTGVLRAMRGARPKDGIVYVLEIDGVEVKDNPAPMLDLDDD